MKLSCVAIISLLWCCCRSEDAHKVVIIGAGPAGIAAAARLLENGVEDIRILEAEPRIGGRIHSVHLGDAFVDLGAEWYHGNKDNVVYSLVKDLDILRMTDFTRGAIHSKPEEYDGELYNRSMEIIDEVYISNNDLPKSGLTIGEFFHAEYDARISHLIKTDLKRVKAAGEVREMLDQFIISSEGSFSVFEPSAENDYDKNEEGDLMTWNGKGYKTILDVLLKKYPNSDEQLPFDDKLLLNKTVTKIVEDRHGAKVICEDGSVIAAEFVIFTPSIGVLKHDHETLFDPPLPKSKVEAIDSLGISGVFKFAMHFSDKWWGNKPFVDVGLIWDDEDKAAISTSIDGPKGNDSYSWATDIYYFQAADNNPKVLQGWIVGLLVPQIEQLPNETLTKGITSVLKKFFGRNYTVTEPTEVVSSSWYTNPHFRGCYSYDTLESSRHKISAREELGTPLLVNDRPTVLFAGEATSRTHYGTVHGAIESGFKEADRIIHLVKN